MSVHGGLQKFSRGEGILNFPYPLQVADNATQMDIHETLK